MGRICRKLPATVYFLPPWVTIYYPSATILSLAVIPCLQGPAYALFVQCHHAMHRVLLLLPTSCIRIFTSRNLKALIFLFRDLPIRQVIIRQFATGLPAINFAKNDLPVHLRDPEMILNCRDPHIHWVLMVDLQKHSKASNSLLCPMGKVFKLVQSKTRSIIHKFN